MNEQIKNTIKGTLGFITYFFFEFGAYYILTFLGININELSEKQLVFVEAFFSIIILAILILISRKKFIENFKDFFKNIKSYLKRNAKYWLWSLLIMFISNLAISLIFNVTTSANDQSVRDLFDYYPIYIFLTAVILAPFTEELVFRQSIRYLIKNKYIFIIASGLIFGFMHISTSLASLADILYIIPYSVPGMAFAYMLVKEDNIMVPISFHVIHNSISMILMLIGKLAGVM